MAANAYIISIDSSDRDRSTWTNSSCFEVKFDPVSGYNGAGIQKSFRNIISIELVDFIHPHVEGCSHLYIKIREIDGNILSTYNGQKYFAKIIPKTIVGGFVYSYNDRSHNAENNGVIFPVRGTRIDKLTFEVLKPNGEVVDFGTDTIEPNAPNPSVQISITLKVVVENIQRY